MIGAGLLGAAVLGGAGIVAGAPMAGAAGKITVTQTPIAPLTTCTTPDQALSYTTFSDASIFRLRVRAASPLCSPITATAAIYAMPGDGSIWPQTLSETATFTIAEAGITDIVFTKDCTPAQFDVVTGATPQTISPLGDKHGPLLIPDVDTAYQDPGIACSPTTTAAPTTTAPGSATTAPGATTTTVGNTGVTNTTTTTAVVLGISSTPTTARPTVLDTVSDRSGTTPASLAVTGVSSQAMGLAGAGLFLTGLGLMLTARRRGVPAVRMVTSSWSVDPNSPFTTR